MHLYGIWAREPNLKSLRHHFHFFIYCIMVHMTLGPKIEPQHQCFLCLFFSFELPLTCPRGCGIKTPEPFYYFFSISPCLFRVDYVAVGYNSHNPSLFLFYFPPSIFLKDRCFDSPKNPPSFFFYPPP